jgi:hypothetical protein
MFLQGLNTWVIDIPRQHPAFFLKETDGFSASLVHLRRWSLAITRAD